MGAAGELNFFLVCVGAPTKFSKVKKKAFSNPTTNATTNAKMPSTAQLSLFFTAFAAITSVIYFVVIVDVTVEGQRQVAVQTLWNLYSNPQTARRLVQSVE